MSDPVRYLNAAALPKPAGHYAHAALGGDLVFVSGQLGARADGSHTVDQPFEVQARQALSNLLAVLDAAGCGPGHVLRVTAYIAGVENWPRFNAVYAEVFGAATPARTVVPVPELHYGYLVEVDAIAVKA
jgi:2-iminobutanoate/2-iminopropanoate deaminase